MNEYFSILKDKNFISGRWIEARENERLTIRDKYSGDVIKHIHYAGKEEINFALEGAWRSFKELKKWSAGKRAVHLEKLVKKLAEKREAFAQLITAEAGKPIDLSRLEVNRCLSTLKLSAEEASRAKGEIVPVDFGIGEGKRAFTEHFPIGPITCFSPFNFPLNLALHKIGPALAVGCPVLLKPSLRTPLTALAFAGLFEDVGYPEGTLNVIVPKDEDALPLITDSRIKMFSFTGSALVGWELKTLANEKKVVLELGSNAAVIVDETADLEIAANRIALGAFSYAGQTCISTQRVYAHQSVFDRLLTLIIQEAKKVKAGSPWEKGNLVGPMISKNELLRVKKWMNEAINEGATKVYGGHILDEERNIMCHSILTNVDPKMKIACEEAFGPVVLIEKVRNFDEALNRANYSVYGLQAGLFTNSIQNMKKAYEEIEVGGLIINDAPGFRLENMPYGGEKASGFGREGIKYAMEEMTFPKLIVY